MIAPNPLVGVASKLKCLSFSPPWMDRAWISSGGVHLLMGLYVKIMHDAAILCRNRGFWRKELQGARTRGLRAPNNDRSIHPSHSEIPFHYLLFPSISWMKGDQSKKLIVERKISHSHLLCHNVSTPSIPLYKATIKNTFCINIRPPTVIEAKINDVFSY